MSKKIKTEAAKRLFQAVLTLETEEECFTFFEDLCTINELRDMSQRLEVARMLEAGDKYDRIEEATGASTATISRVKRCLKFGADGYVQVLSRMGKDVLKTTD